MFPASRRERLRDGNARQAGTLVRLGAAGLMGQAMNDKRQAEREEPNERLVFLAKDTPAEFIHQLEALAAGDFAKAGVVNSEDERAV